MANFLKNAAKKTGQALGLVKQDTADVDMSAANAASAQAAQAANNLKSADTIIKEGQGIARDAAGTAARNAAGEAAKASRANVMMGGGGRLASALAASDSANAATNNAYTNTFNNQLQNASAIGQSQDQLKANSLASTYNAQAGNAASAAGANAAAQNQAEAARNDAFSKVAAGALTAAGRWAGGSNGDGVNNVKATAGKVVDAGKNAVSKALSKLSDEKCKKFKMPKMKYKKGC